MIVDSQFHRFLVLYKRYYKKLYRCVLPKTLSVSKQSLLDSPPSKLETEELVANPPYSCRGRAVSGTLEVENKKFSNNSFNFKFQVFNLKPRLRVQLRSCTHTTH